MEEKDKQILSLKAKMRGLEKENASLKDQLKEMQERIDTYEAFLGVKKDA